MMTLEQAISRLEDMVSGCYKQAFPKSELRTNTKESVELLKFSFMSLLKVKKTALRQVAMENIMTTVLDNTALPKSWQKDGMKTYLDYCRTKEAEHSILKYPDVIEECVECCNVILNRLEDDLPGSESDDMSIKELNRIYHHKYLYFRDDDIGSQYVWVKSFSRDDQGHFLLTGTVIFTNGINNTIGLYDVEDHPIEEFYNFGDKSHPFTKCEDLDKALQKPMDTRLKNHVITCKDVVDDVLFTFTWFYEIHIPELAKILKSMKYTDK